MDTTRPASFGEKIKKLRLEQKLPLRPVSAYLAMDPAILSKIERGLRKPTREMAVKLAEYFHEPEEELIVAWLSDKLLYEIGDEALGLKAMQVAEEKVAYINFRKTDRKKLVDLIQNGISRFAQIKKAWLYGSFARGDDSPKSDIDIAVETEKGLSYFDLAEIQFELEKLINRKIDIGFIDTFKPYIWEHVRPDLKLIYKKG